MFTNYKHNLFFSFWSSVFWETPKEALVDPLPKYLLFGGGFLLIYMDKINNSNNTWLCADTCVICSIHGYSQQ